MQAMKQLAQLACRHAHASLICTGSACNGPLLLLLLLPDIAPPAASHGHQPRPAPPLPPPVVLHRQLEVCERDGDEGGHNDEDDEDDEEDGVDGVHLVAPHAGKDVVCSRRGGEGVGSEEACKGWGSTAGCRSRGPTQSAAVSTALICQGHSPSLAPSAAHPGPPACCSPLIIPQPIPPNPAIWPSSQPSLPSNSHSSM